MSTFRRPAVRPRTRFTLRAAAAIALLTLGAGAASAAVIASGPIFSSDASLVDCLVVNVSSAPVTVLSAAVYNQSGQPASGSNGCTGATLQPNGRCVISVSNNYGWAKVTVSTGVRTVRGQCQLTSSSNNVLATAEMR